LSYLDLRRESRRTIESIRSSNSGTHVGMPSVTVVIPVLREAAVIEGTLDHFAALSRDHQDVRIWVITTARERDERDAAFERLVGGFARKDKPGLWDAASLEIAVAPDHRPKLLAVDDSTRARALLPEVLRPLSEDVAKDAAARINSCLGYEKIRVLVAPRESERKVGQLNYAFTTLRAELAEGETHYIAVYDADSAPEAGVFDAFARALAQSAGAPSIFQQVSCYCKNLGPIAEARAAFRTADAIAQTRWALGFEYGLYRRYHSAVQAHRLRDLAYCVGHGCFVSTDFLIRIDGFPTESETDDLALGYLASAMCEDVAPLPALDFCEAAPDPFATIRQSGFWYRGSARFANDLEIFRRKHQLQIEWRQWWWFRLRGTGRKVAWAWRGAMFVTALAASLALLSPWLLALTLFTHLLYVQVGYWETVGQLRSDPAIAHASGLDDLSIGRLLWGAAVSTPIFLIRSIGPLCASLGIGPGRRAWKSDR
ncbi:MAG: glycosyltransferase, partial [Pseudomonadota bacterium]